MRVGIAVNQQRYAIGSEVWQLAERGVAALVATGAEGQLPIGTTFRSEPPRPRSAAKVVLRQPVPHVKAMQQKMELPENRARYRLASIRWSRCSGS